MKHRAPSLTLPGTDKEVTLPGRAGLAWYAGIGAMAAVELIEWPIALIIAGSHFVEHHARHQAVRELIEGIDAGA